MAAYHSGVGGQCRAALVAGRGRRGRLQGGRRTAGGKEQEGAMVLVGGGGGESPVDEHEQVSIRNGGGGREKGWAVGCIRCCGASAGGAAA